MGIYVMHTHTHNTMESERDVPLCVAHRAFTGVYMSREIVAECERARERGILYAYPQSTITYIL